MAFCRYCGKEIAEGSVCTCPDAMKEQANTNPAPVNMGEQIQASQPETNVQYGDTAAVSDNKKQARNNLIIAGGAVVVLLLLVIIISSIAGGSGYKAPLDDFVSGFNKCNSKKVLNAVYTEDMLDDMADEEDVKLKELYDEMDEELEDVYDDMEDEFGKNTKMKIKVEDKKELSDKKIKEYEENYEDYYDADVEIKKAYELECTISIKGKDDDDEEEIDVVVVKIKGEGWKIYPGSILSFIM